MSATVTLLDGSILKGTLRRRAIPARSPNIGRVRISLAKVESIVRADPSSSSVQHSAFRISFRGGDRLTATLSPKHDRLVLGTLLGPLRIPLSTVRSISFDPPHSAFSTQHSALLYHCTFDSPESISHPAAGPAGTFLGGEFVPGKVGNALHIPGNVPTALVDLPSGMMQPRGTIEFWSKIEDPPASYGDRGNPRFFGLSLFDDPADPGPCSTYLQFTSNDGMGMSGLCGMIYHRAMATDPHMRTNTYGPLLEDPAAWHHYAIVWDSNGLSFSKASDGTPAVAAIVLDGRVLQTFGRNQSAHGKGLLRLPELQGRLAFPVADTGWGFFPRPVAFLIDEFKIWSVPKTDFDIDALPVRHYKPELLYHCTFDSAEAVEKSAAGPNGKFLGGEFVPGKVGNALLVKARTPAAEVPFPTGLMQPEGCIEFWAKIPGATKETRYPDGGNPMFFAMGVGKWVNTFVKYTANDGLGTGGLHADLPGSAYISSLPSWSGSATYPDFLGDPAAWHHYALVWSEKGLSKASEALGRPVVSALYVDGRLVNPAYGTNGPDRAKFLRQFTDLPVVLGFPFLRERQDPKQGQVDYMIDEFKIWSVPKFDSAGTVVLPSRPYKPELIYHCTFDSAEAVEKSAAGPAGKFLGGEFVPGKKGNALRTFADEPAAEADFEPGVLGPRGTIEFWAKKEKSEKGSFAESEGLRFFGLWLYAKGETPPWCSTHFQFTSNDGMGMSGLCGMVNHCSWATKPSFGGWPYDIIRDSLFDWHRYAVVWDAEGLPGTEAPDGGPAVVQVYLDGKPVSTQGRQTVSFGGKHLRDIAPQWGKLAFPTPSNGWGSSGAHIPFLIDEFKIWSAPKTDF